MTTVLWPGRMYMLTGWMCVPRTTGTTIVDLIMGDIVTVVSSSHRPDPTSAPRVTCLTSECDVVEYPEQLLSAAMRIL